MEIKKLGEVGSRVSAQANHLGGGAGLENEDRPLALLAHDGVVARSPRGPGLDQFRPALFARPHLF